jgi:hypothetical protein
VTEVEHSIEWICTLYNQSNNQSANGVTVAGINTSDSDGDEWVHSAGFLRQTGGRGGRLSET